MVKHRKTPKLSSEAKRVRAKVESLTPSEVGGFYEANRAAFQELAEHAIRAYDRVLLLDIANLADAGWEHFHRKHPLAWNADMVLNVRNNLRAIWERTLSDTQVNEVLDGWLKLDTQEWLALQRNAHLPEHLFFPWTPDVRTGRLLPDGGNLPARVVMGVLEYFTKLRKCANPDCVNPYFIANRNSQRFCDQGSCTRYAQNQYALKWWRKKHQSQTTASERNQRGSGKTR
jgi:hypothetical protein